MDITAEAPRGGPQHSIWRTQRVRQAPRGRRRPPRIDAPALARGHEPLQRGTHRGPDGRVFVLYDDCPCLVYGPITENIHAFDERVSIASIKRITGTIALFVAEWCGLERA